jgi:hypothetical protein
MIPIIKRQSTHLCRAFSILRQRSSAILSHPSLHDGRHRRTAALRHGLSVAPRPHGEPPQSGYAFLASSGKSREVHGLQQEAALSVATIRRAEENQTALTSANDLAIRRALESAGVEFIAGRTGRWSRHDVFTTVRLFSQCLNVQCSIKKHIRVEIGSPLLALLRNSKIAQWTICQKKCGQFACRSAGFLYFSFSLIHRIRNVAFRPQWRIPSGDKSSRQAAVLGTAITRCG